MTIGSAVCTALAGLFLAGGSLVLAGQNTPKSGSHKEVHSTQQSADADKSEGAKRFQQNCGRCHRAPETLSSRVAPAVLMHMRVRANLTAEDERLILKFMTQ